MNLYKSDITEIEEKIERYESELERIGCKYQWIVNMLRPEVRHLGPPGGSKYYIDRMNTLQFLIEDLNERLEHAKYLKNEK